MKFFAVVLLALVVACHGAPIVRKVTVSATNNSPLWGSWFSPIVVAAHGGNFSFAVAGELASPELQKLAESGDVSGYASSATVHITTLGDDPSINGGRIAPGATVSVIELTELTETPFFLSFASGLLPSNDAFAINLEPLPFPARGNTSCTYLDTFYDAGTEENDEEGAQFYSELWPGTASDPQQAVSEFQGYLNPAVVNGAIRNAPQFVNVASGSALQVCVSVEDRPAPQINLLHHDVNTDIQGVSGPTPLR